MNRILTNAIGKWEMTDCDRPPEPEVSGSRIMQSELLRLGVPDGPGHLVQFYENDYYLTSAVSRIFSQSLAASYSVAVIATAPHRTDIEKFLLSHVPELERMRREGRYTAVDTDHALSEIMVDGLPDQDRFDKAVGGLVAKASQSCSSRFVVAFGEMVAVLSERGNFQGALRLEQLWNGLARRFSFFLYCDYPLKSFYSESSQNYLFQICAEHSYVVPAESPLR